jgi:tetratricopeptide (TPR) repeat protein
MKQIAVLLISLVFTSLTFAQSNSLQEGNNCFAKGDYACAIAKYKEVMNLQDERRKKIAGDNLLQAEKCFELLRMADIAFSNKNFSKAKEYYLSIVNENPKDEYAKAQLNAIKIELITFSVSKNDTLFLVSGGTRTVYVTTDADSFSIGTLPSWCTVKRNDKTILHYYLYREFIR